MTFQQFFNDSQYAIINTTYTNSHTAALPINAWAVLAVVGAAIAVIAFCLPLRNGLEVNPNRILLSILGMIWCGFTAYASLVVDTVDGSGVAAVIIDNTSNIYSISQHSLIEMPSVGLLFGVVAGLLLLNLVYSLTLKDLVQPDTNDYKIKPKEGRE